MELFLDIETAPDLPDGEYELLRERLAPGAQLDDMRDYRERDEAMRKIRAGELTAASDPATYWRARRRDALSPFTGRVMLVTYQIGSAGGLHRLKEWEDGERDILLRLHKIFTDLQYGASARNSVIVGHNIVGFDLPFIYERMRRHGLDDDVALYRKITRTPKYDFMLNHMHLNGMSITGLKHNAVVRAYGLPTKSTEGGDAVDDYMRGRYDSITRYSEEEFVYPQLYERIVARGLVSARELAESISHDAPGRA